MAGFGDEKLFWCPSLDTAGNGGTTLNDLSGNGYHGDFQVMTGSAWIADTSTNGVRCLQVTSASNHRVTNTTFPNMTNGSWTIGFWFLCDTLTNFMSVAGQGSSTAGFSQYLTTGGAINAFRGSESVARLRTGTGVITAGAWVFCVMESAGSTGAGGMPVGLIYVNGVLQGPAVAAQRSTVTGTGFQFGRGVNGDSSLGGRIDDLRIWDCAIGEKRIAQWYSGGRGFTPAASGKPQLPFTQQVIG